MLMMLLFESADDLNATVNNEDPSRRKRELPLLDGQVSAGLMATCTLAPITTCTYAGMYVDGTGPYASATQPNHYGNQFQAEVVILCTVELVLTVDRIVSMQSDSHQLVEGGELFEAQFPSSVP